MSPCQGEGLWVRVPSSACVPLAQLDRVSDYESEGREFESLKARHVPLAQWIEQQPSKLWVVGSNPSRHVLFIAEI